MTTNDRKAIEAFWFWIHKVIGAAKERRIGNVFFTRNGATFDYDTPADDWDLDAITNDLAEVLTADDIAPKLNELDMAALT